MDVLACKYVCRHVTVEVFVAGNWFGNYCQRNGNVHAYLSDLAPNLVQAYINNNICKVVDDPYFQDSLIVRKKECQTNLSVVKQSSSKSKNLLPHSVNATRVKCRVCDVSWASVQKKNIMTHLNKYHAHRMRNDVVVGFQEMLPVLKK